MVRYQLRMLLSILLALNSATPWAQTNGSESFGSARRMIEHCLNLRSNSCLAEYFPIAARTAESASDRLILKTLQDRNAARDLEFEGWMQKYCLKFHQIPQQMVGTVIKDMEASAFNVDRYFITPHCQPEGYSDAVQSPLLHIVADDPNAREKFLWNIYAYYAKKRKQPELFTVALNSKNTKGETLLDYFESLRKNRVHTMPEQMVVIVKIIAFSCEHGAVYESYNNLSCPESN